MATDNIINNQEKIKAPKDSNKLSELLLKQQEGHNLLYSDTIRAITALMDFSERYFFASPIKYVSLLCKSIADKIKISEEEKHTLTLCVMLYNMIIRSLPEKYVFIEPYEIEDVDETTNYFEVFTNSLNAIINLKSYQKHARLLSQIWENSDGSGLPNGVPGGQLSKSSQILKIAYIYHFHTYGLTKRFFETLMLHGTVIQTALETKKRHEDAVKLIFRRIKWFDYDVFQAFQELWKQKSCPALIPVNKDLIIQKEYNRANSTAVFNDEDETIEGSDIISYNPKNNKDEIMIEKDIKIEHIKPGMIVGQNVVTRKGILVVRQDNVLTAKLVSNIQQLENTGMLGSYITIMVPKE